MLKLPFGSLRKPETEVFLSETIQHHQFLDALNKIGNTHGTAMGDAKGMLLIGDTGTGKSTVADTYINKYLQGYGSLDTDETTFNPILKISIESDATIIGILTKLLRELDHENCDTGTQAKLTHRFVRSAKERGVELIILDEFQHLLRNQALKRTRNTANALKTLHDDLKIPFVMIGMPESREVVEAHPELYRRFTFQQVELCGFSLDTEEEKVSFESYMKSCASILLNAGVKTSKIWSEAMLLRFYVATKGRPAHIASIFERVLQDTDLSERLTKDDFARSYQGMRLVREIGAFNPFSASIEACQKKYIQLQTKEGK